MDIPSKVSHTTNIIGSLFWGGEGGQQRLICSYHVSYFCCLAYRRVRLKKRCPVVLSFPDPFGKFRSSDQVCQKSYVLSSSSSNNVFLVFFLHYDTQKVTIALLGFLFYFCFFSCFNLGKVKRQNSLSSSNYSTGFFLEPLSPSEEGEVHPK